MGILDRGPHTAQRFLLLPAMPTPNGRLHLGHMGGPFLKMDVLARLLRRDGHQAAIYSASDVYESYVLLESHRSGTSPEEVSGHYHRLIEEDLSALRIECEAYLNPLDPTYRERTDTIYQDTLRTLSRTGCAFVREEQVLFSPSTGKFIVGGWLTGNCPHCGSAAGSYLCEACGMQFNPEELANPEAVTGEKDLRAEAIHSLFLRVRSHDALRRHIERMQVQQRFIEVVDRYMRFYDGQVRLTNPGKWGAFWGDEILLHNNRHVVFPYCGLLSLSLLCAEAYQQRHALPVPPFDPGSDVVTVASFGIDSTVPWFVGVLGAALESKAWKPFDYFLTNYFYYLEGAKFSTSRQHVIWASDIVQKTPATSDAVRFFLLSDNPEHRETSFSVAAFVAINNDFLAGRMQELLDRHHAAVVSAPCRCAPPDNLVEAFVEKIEEQSRLLIPPGQQIKKGLQPLLDWVELGELQGDWESGSYWYVKAFAYLAFPVMPTIAGDLLTRIGDHCRPPRLTEFLDRGQSAGADPLPRYFPRMEKRDLMPCLPETAILS